MALQFSPLDNRVFDAWGSEVTRRYNDLADAYALFAADQQQHGSGRKHAPDWFAKSPAEVQQFHMLPLLPDAWFSRQEDRFEKEPEFWELRFANLDSQSKRSHWGLGKSEGLALKVLLEAQRRGCHSLGLLAKLQQEAVDVLRPLDEQITMHMQSCPVEESSRRQAMHEMLVAEITEQHNERREAFAAAGLEPDEVLLYCLSQCPGEAYFHYLQAGKLIDQEDMDGALREFRHAGRLELHSPQGFPQSLLPECIREDRVPGNFTIGWHLIHGKPGWGLDPYFVGGLGHMHFRLRKMRERLSDEEKVAFLVAQLRLSARLALDPFISTLGPEPTLIAISQIAENLAKVLLRMGRKPAQRRLGPLFKPIEQWQFTFMREMKAGSVWDRDEPDIYDDPPSTGPEYLDYIERIHQYWSATEIEKHIKWQALTDGLCRPIVDADLEELAA